MQIFVLPGSEDGSNLGDVAMLQAALPRLQALWPGATFQVLTADAARLLQHCPGVNAVGWKGMKYWSGVSALPGRLFPGVPAETRRRFPFTLNSAAGLIHWAHPRKFKLAREFAGAFFGADLVVISGCGVITDSFRGQALMTLDLIEAAARAGIPSVMLSQGIGPIGEEHLLERASRILPMAKTIFIRERLATSPFLERLGVPREKIIFTGDDAVELAFREKRVSAGNGLGVNLRLAEYAVNQETLGKVRDAIFEKARSTRARVWGIPILNRGEHSDREALAQLFAGQPDETGAGSELDTPLKVVQRISDCRLVIAGSYHAAVFALAQGVPAIAVVRSAYYRDKFRGLHEQFGDGCVVLEADAPKFSIELRAVMDELWEKSGSLRPKMLAVSENLVEAARSAYAKIPEILRR